MVAKPTITKSLGGGFSFLKKKGWFNYVLAIADGGGVQKVFLVVGHRRKKGLLRVCTLIID